MNTLMDRNGCTIVALELFQPRPDVFYSLEATAHIACVSRRTLLVYWRAGLVDAVLQPPYGVVEFTEEAIYAVRRLERLREAYGFELGVLRSMVELLDEVDRLRAEVRALRAH
jgi:MerR family transcriptional regulator/heat shock protein HspR